MKKPKQEELPGVEGPGVAPVRIPKLDKAVDEYVNERDARSEMSPKEKAAKQKVIDLMIQNQDKIGVNENNDLVYRCGDETVTLKPGKPDLRVRRLTEVT